MKNYHLKPSTSVSGSIQIPGDKSISHRAVMLSSIAEGKSVIKGLLESTDVLATANAFRQMGVKIAVDESGLYHIDGVGLHGLKAPKGELDMGNSGTAMRLISGILCAQKFSTELTGDESLSKRPMMRIIDPLVRMGANVKSLSDGRPPLYIDPVSNIRGAEFHLDIASAQVKSAILLAAIYADKPSIIHEIGITRDHTEKMLQGMGCHVSSDANIVTIEPPKKLNAIDVEVPGDISSAMFFVVAGLLSKQSQLTIEHVGINPTRHGALEILKLMGAQIELKNKRTIASEQVADIVVKSSQLKGIHIPEHLVELAIDEFPVIAVAASQAKGQTIISGAGELRVKESDRIASTVAGLVAIGVNATERHDGMVIQSSVITGGKVKTCDDHRIAMSFAVASIVSQGDILIEDCDNVETSFPNFFELARSIGLNIDYISTKALDAINKA